MKNRPSKSTPYLYKFRCFDNPNHFRTIEYCEFWFASPTEFNDPFDCNIPIRFDLCPKEWRYEKMLQHILSINPHLSKEKAEAKARRAADDDEGWLREQRRVYCEVIGPKNGILSLTPHWNTVESLLMWSHYANSHKGFAVGLVPCQDECDG